MRENLLLDLDKCVKGTRSAVALNLNRAKSDKRFNNRFKKALGVLPNEMETDSFSLAYHESNPCTKRI